MKFLKKDGTIEEGVALSETEVRHLESLTQVLHASMCRNAFHPSYEREEKCRKVAIAVISGKTLEAALADEYLPKPSSEEEHPSPYPTGVEA